MFVDKIEGSCMLIKKEVFKDIGFFDEDYFCYWEETDFCIRAKRKNYKLKYNNKSKIWHKKHSSFKEKGESLFVIFYTARNKFLFLYKNYSWFVLFINIIVTLVWDLWAHLFVKIKSNNFRGYIIYLKGIFCSFIKIIEQ